MPTNISTLPYFIPPFDYRLEFKNNNQSAYHISYRNKIIDELFKNHKNYGYQCEKWRENNYVIYAYEIIEFNTAYIGLTNNIRRRDKEHLFDNKSELSIFLKCNNLSLPKYKIIEENLNSIKAQQQEKYWMLFYKKNNWNLFNKAKPGNLGGTIKKWSKNKLQKEANKYKTRSEFAKYSSSAYSTAASKKLIDELFKNHENQGFTYKQMKCGYWSIDKLQSVADNYKTRNDFRKYSYSFWIVAHNKNLMNTLFKNHENQGYIRNIHDSIS